MVVAIFVNNLSESVCVLMRASARGPGDVFPGDGVADEAGVELLCLSERPPDRELQAQTSHQLSG